jgi:Trk-type K+ transport system membrane component
MRFINPRVILRILSTILFIETVSFLLCLPVAHIYDESPYPFLWSSIITITVSVVFFLISKDAPVIKINMRESFLTGTDPVSSASAVASTLGNVGPGLGTVGPMSNYAHMPTFSKVVFSLLMIIGRLEINTLFIIFGRSFWKL